CLQIVKLFRRKKYVIFFFSSRRRHTRSKRDWSSDVCSSDLFLTHLQNYMKLMGLNNENELKLNLDNADQMQALKSDPSIKSMLINMVQGQEGNRAQAALLHFINGMQMQSIT